MKNYKKTLAIILGIIIILIVLTVVLIKKINSNEKEQSNEIQNTTTSVTSNEGQNNQGISRGTYFGIKRVVENYYNHICTVITVNNSANSGEISPDDLKIIKENQKTQYNNIYGVLSQEYINAYNITADNIESNLEEKEMCTIKITSIKEIARNNNVNVYYVESDLTNANTLKIDNRKQLVYVDEKNGSYSLTLNNLVNQKYNNINENTSINIPNSIEKNDANSFQTYNVSDDEYANELVSDLLYNILFNSQKAYNFLNNDYKNKRFPNINDFNSFIKDNNETYYSLYRSITGNTLGLKTSQELENYRSNRQKYGIKLINKKDYGNYVQYIIMDNENKYYIFNEHGTMEYDVLMDSYTIETELLKGNLDDGLSNSRCAYEIRKYFEMINLMDYDSAYNKLDASIKNSNSRANYENYIKLNFDKTNLVENVQQTEKENNIEYFKVNVREGSKYGQVVKEIILGVSLVDGEYKIIIRE